MSEAVVNSFQIVHVQADKGKATLGGSHILHTFCTIHKTGQGVGIGKTFQKMPVAMTRLGCAVIS